MSYAVFLYALSLRIARVLTSHAVSCTQSQRCHVAESYQHEDAVVKLDTGQLGQVVDAAGYAKQAAFHAERGDACVMQLFQGKDGWLHRAPVV